MRHIPTRLVDVIDGISQSAPYIYHFKHMVDPINGQGIFESDLEPYTEPKEDTYSSPAPIDFDKIMQNDRKERRLNIAAMAMQGMLANSHPKMVDMPFDQVSKMAILMADVLIAESEKGGVK